MNHDQTILHKIYFYLTTLVVMVASIAYLLRPVSDPDFFWHLKTGEWMWQHKSLISNDPFTTLPLPEQTTRSQFILTSYWLSQIIMYAVYAVAGLPGIVFYRGLVTCVIFYGISRWVSLRQWYIIATVGIFWSLTMGSFFIERPHFLSFIFMGGLLIIVFNFLEKPESFSFKQLAVPLSAVMLVWGNTHGGFLVGQIILFLIILTEGGKFLSPPLFNPLSYSAYKKLTLASCIAIIAALCNPNPVKSIVMFFTAGNTNNFLYTTNFEYASLIQLITVNQNQVAMLFIASMIFSVIIFFTSKLRSNITWIAIIVVTAFMGMKHIRYIPFFFVVATLSTTRIFSTEPSRITIKALTALFCCLTVYYSMKNEPHNMAILTRYGLVSATEYPVQAADFVERNDLKGNIFNEFNWGGYLVWRFGESKRVFCDGRQLYPARYWEYLTTISVGKEEPIWKKTFQKYDIETVILPFWGKNGKENELNRALRSDTDWVMVYTKNNAAVFRKVITK